MTDVNPDVKRMYTSYYAKAGGHENAVAISSQPPQFYKGCSCTRLGPSYSIFSEWKRTGDSARFTQRFNDEILNNLDPFEIYTELGEGAVLICYESPGDFCHRHLVALWLMKHIPGLVIEELTFSNKKEEGGFGF